MKQSTTFSPADGWLSSFVYCPRCGSKRFIPTSERSKRCKDCDFTYYINGSGAYVAFILNNRGELLFTLRKREPAKGTLDIPGGFSDPGESAEEGIAREVEEETGLKVVTSKYLFSIPNRYEFSGMAIPTLDLFFLCEIDGDGSNACASDDAEALFWIKPNDVKLDRIGLNSIRQGVARFINSLL